MYPGRGSFLPPDFCKIIFSQGQGHAGYETPSDELLRVSGVVNDREIQQPRPNDDGKAAALLIVKNGWAASTVVGRVYPGYGDVIKRRLSRLPSCSTPTSNMAHSPLQGMPVPSYLIGQPHHRHTERCINGLGDRSGRDFLNSASIS